MATDLSTTDIDWSFADNLVPADEYHCDIFDLNASCTSDESSACGSSPATPSGVSCGFDCATEPLPTCDVPAGVSLASTAAQMPVTMRLTEDLDGPIFSADLRSIDRAVYRSVLVRSDCYAGDHQLTNTERSEIFRHSVFSTIADLRHNLQCTAHLMDPLEFTVLRDGHFCVLHDSCSIMPGSTIYMRPAREDHRNNMIFMNLELTLANAHVAIIVGKQATTAQLVDLFLSKVNLNRDTGSLYFLLPSGTPVMLRPNVFHTPAHFWSRVPGGSVFYPAIKRRAVDELTIEDTTLFANLELGYGLVVHNADAEFDKPLMQALSCDPALGKITMENQTYNHALFLSLHCHGAAQSTVNS